MSRGYFTEISSARTLEMRVSLKYSGKTLFFETLQNIPRGNPREIKSMSAAVLRLSFGFFAKVRPFEYNIFNYSKTLSLRERAHSLKRGKVICELFVSYFCSSR